MKPSTKKAFMACLLALLGAVGLLLWGDRVPESSTSRSVDAGLPIYSNVRWADYVGPKICSDCHEKRYQEWQGNLHRRMNRLVSEPDAVLGDFANHREGYAGGEILLEREDQSYFMSLLRDGALYRRYLVTRTIGSRYLQEYVGLQVHGPEPLGHSVYRTELRLPFGYLIRDGRWLHQQYFDSWYEDEYLPSGDPALAVFDPLEEPWRGRCAWCHNTYPFEKRLARLQGTQQVGSGIELLYRDGNVAQESAESALLLDEADFVSVGISCESCHFGGREHAINGKAIRFAPSGEGITADPQAPSIAGTRRDSRTINSICAQCHSAPTLLFANGAGMRNSSEALDLMSGACASQIKCTDCHDPHVAGPGAMAPAQDHHLQACLSCHQNLADNEVARRHSKHEAKVTCLDCHMPRIVQGMDTLIRSHRISSPEDADMLSDGVNACNLCHLDQSLAWTVETLNRDYGQSLELSLDSRPAGEVWLLSETRILRLTAAGRMQADSLGKRWLRLLLARLADPVAYDRLRYLWATEAALGRKLEESEYNVTAPPDQLSKQMDALIQSL